MSILKCYRDHNGMNQYMHEYIGLPNLLTNESLNDTSFKIALIRKCIICIKIILPFVNKQIRLSSLTYLSDRYIPLDPDILNYINNHIDDSLITYAYLTTTLDELTFQVFIFDDL